jgi:hypothetical protein
MKTEWTDLDEKLFASLLERRRAAAAEALEEVNASQEAINTYAEMIVEDYDAQDAWENFLAWTAPAEVQTEMQELKEFMGDAE